MCRPELLAQSVSHFASESHISQHSVAELPTSEGVENDPWGQQFNRFPGAQENEKAHYLLLTLRFVGELVHHRRAMCGGYSDPSFRRPGVGLVLGLGLVFVLFFSLK